MRISCCTNKTACLIQMELAFFENITRRGEISGLDNLDL